MSQNDPTPEMNDEPASNPNVPDRFAKWTSAARAILAASEREAVRLGDHFIGDEHIFLGVLNDPQTTAAKVLMEQGISLEQARNVVAAMPGRGEGVVQGNTIVLAPKGKQAIVRAVDEARAHRQKRVDATYVLMALAYQGCVTGDILQVFGVSPATVYDLARRSSIVAANQPMLVASPERQRREESLPSRLLRRRSLS